MLISIAFWGFFYSNTYNFINILPWKLETQRLKIEDAGSTKAKFKKKNTW